VASDTPIRDLGKSKKANRGDRVFNTTKTGAAFTSLAVDYRDFSILELVSKAIRGHSAGGSPAENNSQVCCEGTALLGSKPPQR
jgi:hypothetical protein